MSEKERKIAICLVHMLNIIEAYEERHNRHPFTRFLNWLYGT